MAALLLLGERPESSVVPAAVFALSFASMFSYLAAHFSSQAALPAIALGRRETRGAVLESATCSTGNARARDTRTHCGFSHHSARPLCPQSNSIIAA